MTYKDNHTKSNSRPCPSCGRKCLTRQQFIAKHLCPQCEERQRAEADILRMEQEAETEAVEEGKRNE